MDINPPNFFPFSGAFSASRISTRSNSVHCGKLSSIEPHYILPFLMALTVSSGEDDGAFNMIP